MNSKKKDEGKEEVELDVWTREIGERGKIGVVGMVAGERVHVLRENRRSLPDALLQFRNATLPRVRLDARK